MAESRSASSSPQPSSTHCVQRGSRYGLQLPPAIISEEECRSPDSEDDNRAKKKRATIIADTSGLDDDDSPSSNGDRKLVRQDSMDTTLSTVSRKSTKSLARKDSTSSRKSKSDARTSLSRQLALFVGGGEDERKYQIESSLLAMPIFEHHPEAFIKQVADKAVWKSFNPGINIAEQHHAGHSMTVILSGEVLVYIDGHEVSELGQGDVWGEANMLGLDEKHSATLTPIEPTNFCEISHESYLDVLYQWADEQKVYEEFAVANKICMQDGTVSHTCEIFRGLSNSTLVGLDISLVRRIYFPGEYILRQGATGDSLVMLVRGSVDVEIDGNIVQTDARGVRSTSNRRATAAVVSAPGKSSSSRKNLLVPGEAESRPGGKVKFDMQEKKEDDLPICYGELGLLGMQDSRVASIIANSVCHVRILYRSVFMRYLDEHHESLESDVLSDFLHRRYHGSSLTPQPMLQTMKEIEIFKEVGCGADFLEFLADNLEDRMFLAGQRIIDENVADDRCMYILGRGKARVMKADVEVAVLTSGAVFGEVVCLGLASKRQTTVTAAELCYTQVLSQKDVIRGLEKFPEEREKVLMIAFKRGAAGETVPTKADGSPDWKANHVHAVIKAARNHPIFGKIGVDFIKALSELAVDRIFMPGDLIIQEGQKGDSLFIMVSGQATVYTTQDAHGQQSKAARSDDPKANMMRIGMLSAGSISGELSMLGIAQKRSASIEAETICVMWEITHEKAMPIIDQFPQSRVHFLDSVCTNLEHTVSSCIDSVKLFKQFDRKFRMILSLYCERRAFFPGERIFQEGHQGDGLYILNLGMAAQERKAIPIKTCAPGAYFNATIMLGIHKQCFSTLTATHTCHIVVIARGSYVQALEQYPSHEVAHDLHKSEQAAEEEFREAIRRLCSRGLLWNKSQAAVAEAFQRLTEKVSDQDVLKKAMKVWKRYSQESYRQRRGRANRRHAMQDWIKKQRLAVSRRRQGSHRDHVREEDFCESVSSFSPQRKANKFTKLSTLYLGSGRDWESIMPSPQTSQHSQFSATSFNRSSESYSRLPRTPRRLEPLAFGPLEHSRCIIVGSRPALALPWE
mmetsp:Transcript_92851/g.144822  ORF Transcript_92851/g.144822 Transcript_92851/m.144822 type:complete len:1082 (+) Transcript_92851:127-3372(+)